MKDPLSPNARGGPLQGPFHQATATPIAEPIA